MANLTLELNINSASNLANVNLFTKMDVYAVITVNGDKTQKKQKVKTPVDRSGGSNPTWNHAVKFSVNERLVHDGRLTLVMRLVSRRVLGNKDIGKVNVPLLELLNSITPLVNGNGNGQEMKFVTYMVRSPSGKRKGSLSFSYRFNTPPVQPDLPAIVNRNTAPLRPDYRPPSQIKLFQLPRQHDSDHRKRSFAAGDSSYDPLPVSYGPGLMDQPYFSSTTEKLSHAPLQPPSHRGYGYVSPSPAGYGYGGPSTQQSKGIGLGLGLGAGLLGGLMMGDLVSDVANCFDL